MPHECVFCGKTVPDATLVPFGPVVFGHIINGTVNIKCPFSGAPVQEVDELRRRMQQRERKKN